MSTESDPGGQWQQIALELRACKESQQKAWGQIDNTTLGRYLAGEASDHELATVENALHELPELRKLTELVRDVLNDLEPVAFDAPPDPVAVSRPVLAFSPKPAASRRRMPAFLRGRSSVAAAACLLLICGLAMPHPGFLSAPLPNETPRLTGAVASRSEGARPLPGRGCVPPPHRATRTRTSCSGWRTPRMRPLLRLPLSRRPSCSARFPRPAPTSSWRKRCRSCTRRIKRISSGLARTTRRRNTLLAPLPASTRSR